MDADKKLLSSTKKAVSIVSSREKEWQEVREECVQSLHADRGLVGSLIPNATTSAAGGKLAIRRAGGGGGDTLEAELEAERKALEETRRAINEAHGRQQERIPWMHRQPAAAAGVSIELEAAQKDLQDTRVQIFSATAVNTGGGGGGGGGGAAAADQFIGVASLRATVPALSSSGDGGRGGRGVSASVTLEAAIEEERRLLAELRIKIGGTNRH